MSSYKTIFFDSVKLKKQCVLFLALMFFGILFSSAQTTAVPDANFEDYLETHDENGFVVNLGDATSMGDGIAGNATVTTAKISDVLSLDVSNLDISDLTGIQDFTNLETLLCSGNNLTAIDVSNNANLKALLCGSNLLTVLQLENNSNLETLNCSNNQIQNLNLVDAGTQNPYHPLLKNLTCSSNQLATIDVSKHNDLSLLNVSKNRLTGALDVSNNSNLENLFCASNQISTLNLSSNTALKNLDASDNLLVNLDVTAINTAACPDPQTDPLTVCQGTGSINVSQNQLTSLNVANGFNDLVSSFSAEDNPDLSCIQVDVGFTPPNTWLKDDWTYYDENTCMAIFTYVPDDNFEQALIDAGHDTVLDNFVLTSNINALTTLNVPNKAISDLTGIEGFGMLRTLDCSTNTLENLDLSTNTDLLQLNCSGNSLSDINLNTNTLLTSLDCSNNSMSSLNISNNTSLVNLNCSNNALVDLNLVANTLLTDVDCSNNQIENLNTVANTALTTLLCNDNSLLALNVQNGNNGSLSTFNATNNPNLFCIQVDNVANANAAAGWQKDAPALYNLNCGTYVPDDNFENHLEANGLGDGIPNNNFVSMALVSTFFGPLDVSGLGISDLTGIEDFLLLQNLNCSNNMLSELDVSNNSNLEILECSFNQIENLDVVSNIALTSLLCNDNALFTLNIKNGNNNALATLNATNNPNLFCINVDDAIIGNIPAGWQKDLTTSYNNDCDNNRFTAIPDNFFEQALIDLGLDSGPSDNQVLTANIEHLTTLNVRNKQIQSLEGIKGFSLLQNLECSNNYLNDLDLSGMIYLEELYCGSNYFLTNNPANPNGVLNTTGTINLIKLFCSGNKLADLDTALQANLEALDCADNNLGVLNISGNTLLRELNCSNNNLTNLDLSTNAVLEDVNCDSNTISNLTTINVNNTTLTNLSCANNTLGTLLINNYTALLSLNCSLNDLTQLNTASNGALEILDVTDNAIANLTLTNNTNLVSLKCSQNELTDLIVNTNTLLETLYCDANQLSSLLVNSAASIKFLSCASNQLTDLDVSNNPDLIELNVSLNALTSLMLSSDLNQLKTFNCSGNMLDGDIDLSTMGTGACPTLNANTPQEFCPSSISINVSNNRLEFLNIQNGVNGNISVFNATLNPDLTCIQVDDTNTIGANWQKDTTSEYNIDCRYGETYVPDDNFEQALITLGFDTLPLNDYVPTATIEVLTDLDVNTKNITDLTGIEDFRDLQNLNISNNTLTTIGLSKLSDLNILNCSNTNISDLDITGNALLTTLDCSNNTISTLDVSATPNLINLNIASNNFTEFIPSDIPTLQIFNCDSNQLVDLDFSMNTALTSLSCASNLLETLNLKNGQNGNLANLDAQNNADLNCIETDTGAVPGGVTWLKDTTTQYTINCHFGETYVPDDGFETALINLGYDTGVLDDYVPTSNINGISILDIGGNAISDVTGIEDFVSLTTLVFEENTITSVDLSSNLLLVNLNASNNAIAAIDVSMLSNLRALNISNNALTQINLDSNLSLLELDVSNNQLTALDVGLLVDLEKLNCGSNSLEALNVTSNSKLTELFCQANNLMQDQLNLQNGANATLRNFSATDNPNLGCILVDNPVDVITNANGTYDNWFKDASASYQTICADADNDGVANVDDICPATPFGEPVDLFGCPYSVLPEDNFTILITGETCLNNNDGKINVTTKTFHEYKANLKGDDFDKDYTFTNEINILNLLAGTYRLCITSDELPNFQRCFDIVINHPENLEVITGKKRQGKEVSLDMSGSSNYTINFNGLEFKTSESQITLQLEAGKNTIKISTDLPCQGAHEESIFLSDEMFVFPNPFQDEVQVYLGNITDEKNTELSIYTYLGQKVYSRNFKELNSRSLNIDTSSFSSGMYTLFVRSNDTIFNFKIVKK